MISEDEQELVKTEVAVNPDALGTLTDKEALATAFVLDSDFYSRTFFPNTVRRESPEFHKEIWDVMERQENQYVANAIFRSGAKTTITRLFTSKRMAFGYGWFTQFISRSQTHSVSSVKWMRTAVTYNKRWSEFFGLTKGQTWTENEIEIIHNGFGKKIMAMAMGITGQVRGFNIDDMRPDLIAADDVDSEETVNTPEQRGKTQDIFFGAIARSLASKQDIPHSKMVLNQTPLNVEDLLMLCIKDPMWASRIFGCFDKNGMSRWENMFSTEQLNLDKQGYIQRNQASLWAREMECTIIAVESKSFRGEWLKIYTDLPEGGFYVISIDPAAAESRESDNQVIAVQYFHGFDVYLVTYHISKADMPEEVWNTLYQYCRDFHPLQFVGIQAIAYEKILERFLTNKMRETGVSIPICPLPGERRSKESRLIQSFSGRASYGRYHIRECHSEFVTEFIDHSPTPKGHGKDDILDACSIGIELIAPSLQPVEAEMLNDTIGAITYAKPHQKNWRTCP